MAACIVISVSLYTTAGVQVLKKKGKREKLFPETASAVCFGSIINPLRLWNEKDMFSVVSAVH